MILISLFNQGYDYARIDKTGNVQGCEQKSASHSLQCTRWNSDGQLPKNFKQRLRAIKTRPEGFALSVCAVPIHGPRKKAPVHKFKFRLSGSEIPVYEAHGSLEGKRAVLCSMAQAHRTPTKMRREIRKLGNEKCDALFRQFLRSNRAARAKKTTK